MIQAVIFDMDGVLLDSMPVWNQAPVLYLQSQGITPEENLGAVMHAMTMDEGTDYLIQRFQLKQTRDELQQGISDCVLEYYRSSISLKPGAFRLLAELKRRNIPVTLATTSLHCMAEAAFRRLEIRQYFDGIFTSEDSGNGKDRPDLFLMAANFMGTQPEDTWVFEDSLHAVQTARAAGFHTVGIYDAASESKQEELKKVSDVYVRSLKEVQAEFGLE